MKKFLTVCLIVLISGFVYSQEQIPTPADYQAFAKSTTLVVLDDNPMSEYNFRIRDVIQKNWTLSCYEFITSSEFEKKRFNPKYSFIINTLVTFNKDKTKARYNFLSLLMGGSAKRIANMPDLCSVPLSYKNVDEDSYAYKLPCFIRFMQNHVQMVSKNPDIITDNVLKYYNKNRSLLGGRILYLVKNELANNVNSLAKIRKVYSGKVKIVSREEVEKAIANKDESVVFLHKVGPELGRIKARCFKILVGASDSKFYYFDYHMINKKNPDAFLAKDFRRITQ